MNKTIYIVISLICISLAGIIGVQFFWIKNAYEIKEAQFNKLVNDAMVSIVDKVETSENIDIIEKTIIDDNKHSKSINKCSKIKCFKNKHVDYQKDTCFNMHFIVDDSLINNSIKMVLSIDSLDFDNYIKIVVDTSISSDLNEKNKIISQKFEFSSNISSDKKYKSAIAIARTKVIKKSTNLKNTMKKILLESEKSNIPIDKRIDSNNIKKIIFTVLSDKGVNQATEYAVIHNDTIQKLKSKNFSNEFINTSYKMMLFPNDLNLKSAYLLLYFPEKNSYLINSLSILLFTSLFFSFFIVIASVLGILVMLRQKKMSDIKTDFINNMTHEFKTPIATISVASDSIVNPKVINDAEQIITFSNIIKEENKRMNSMIERVLQIALIDKKDFYLNFQEVDLHDILFKAVDKIKLQVEKRNGKIDIQLFADKYIVDADEIHIFNVIMNILDNANKYCQKVPEIKVKTENFKKNIKISIEDNGIGMSKESQKRIFERFFRVATGNIHNVKGFGLGLSYSKAIILAHKGEIIVSSDIGKGSVFEVILPISE